jgi:hypothetical protein
MKTAVLQAPSLFPTTPLLDDLSALPHNAKLFIMDAGIPSKILKRRMISAREDLTILGFIDSFREGSVDKLPIFKPERLECRDYDGIAIASKESGAIIAPMLRAFNVPQVFEYSKDLLDADYFSPYIWLEDAIGMITIDKPVLLLGKGPGLSRVPVNAAESHFVISINQAFMHLEKADLVFLLDLEHLIHVLFTPGFGKRWERIFLPDGLMKCFDNVVLDQQPFGKNDFADIQPQYRDRWGYDFEVPFEEVDRILDFSWNKSRIVRFNLQNVYWDPQVHPTWTKMDPGLTAFQPDNLGQPNVLKSGCNSAHLALSFLYRKGVKQIMTAGMGGEEGYAKGISRDVHYDPRVFLQGARWRGTQKVIEHLGMRAQRVEDFSDAEIKQKFGSNSNAA